MAYIRKKNEKRGDSMGRKQRRFTFAFVVLLCSLFFSDTNQESLAAETGATITPYQYAVNDAQKVVNLVVCVRFAGDSRDVFNATYDASYKIYRNWDNIKEMY